MSKNGKSKALAVVVGREKAMSPADSIREAIAGGADLDKLKGLLKLQERWEANEAKKSYHIAMAAFKADPPDIEKDKKVSYLNVKFSHASLSNVTKKINEVLSRHGLSASWNVKQNGAVSVTCKITHEKGHSEETTLTAPADTSGSKNAIQSIGSTISYLERYTLLALTGLATSDMDDDGKISGNAELISEQEANSLLENLQAIEANIQKFLEYMKVGKIENILKLDLPKAYIAIEKAKAKKGVK